MMKEKYGTIEATDDLTNEDVVRKILESGTDEEMGRLRSFHNLTFEKLRLLRSFARLRKNIHEEGERQCEKRKQKNSMATAEELNMGAYKESIEPQVLNAVLNLRKKGYNTHVSGFWGIAGSQMISFEENPLDGFQFPASLVAKLQSRGIKLKVRPNAISFECGRYLDIDELKKVWDEIEKAVPDLKKSAPECHLSQARSFREKQEKLKT